MTGWLGLWEAEESGGSGSSTACSSWHKPGTSCSSRAAVLPRGVSKQTFTSDVESKINHLAFFLSKRRKKKSSGIKKLKEIMFKDKRLWAAEVIWAEGQGCALPL